MYSPKVLIPIHRRSSLSRIKFVLMMCIIIPINTLFAANDSTQRLTPSTNVRQQYLAIDSQNPTQTGSTHGASYQTISCGQNQQIVGMIEESSGGNSDPGNMAFARTAQYRGNYVYIPRCTNPSIFTGQCGRDWVKEYHSIDTLSLLCATNAYLWEDQSSPHPNPIHKANVIGSYEPAP